MAENGVEHVSRAPPLRSFGIPGAPCDESVRSNEHTPARLEPEGCVESASRVLQTVPPHLECSDRHPKLTRSTKDAVAPRCAVRRGEQSEPAAEKVERRYLPAIRSRASSAARAFRAWRGIRAG